MADVRIEKERRNGWSASFLREEKKMLPADANELAWKMPTKPGLSGYRMIPEFPAFER
jgi:hypothetical protein